MATYQTSGGQWVNDDMGYTILATPEQIAAEQKGPPSPSTIPGTAEWAAAHGLVRTGGGGGTNAGYTRNGQPVIVGPNGVIVDVATAVSYANNPSNQDQDAWNSALASQGIHGTGSTPSSDGPNPFGLLAGVAAGAMLPSVLSGMPSMPAGWDEGAAFGGTAGPSMTTAMGPASQVGGAFTNNVVDPLEGPMTNWGQPNPTNPYNGSTSWPNDSVTAPDGSTPPNGGAGPGMPSLSQLGQGASIASALKNFFGGNGSLQSTLNGLTSGNGSNGSNGSTDWGKVFSGLLGNSLSNDAIRGTVNSTLDKLINSDQRRTTQPLYEGMFRDVATNGLGNTPLGRNIASSVFRQDAAKGYGPNEGNAVHDVAQGLNSGGVGVMQALTPAAFFQPSPLYAGGQALSTLAGQQASNQGNLGTVIQEVGKSLPSLSDLFKTSGNTTSGGNDSGNWFQSLIGNTNTTNPETNPNWSMA